MFKKWLFLHSQLCRTVPQGKRQHRAFLPHSHSGACRALRRVALASQGSPKEMPPCHTLGGPLPLNFQWLYSHFPHLSPDIQSFTILCKHILLNLCTPHFLNHILPSLCMPKWHILLFLFSEFRTCSLHPHILPPYSTRTVFTYFSIYLWYSSVQMAFNCQKKLHNVKWNKLSK